MGAVGPRMAGLPQDAGCEVPLPSSIAGVLRRVTITHNLVVVAAHWPSWLVPVIGLELPLQDAFFSSSYHRCFKAKHLVCKWKTPRDLFDHSMDPSPIYLVSGTLSFVRTLQPWFQESQRLIVSIEINRRSGARKAI